MKQKTILAAVLFASAIITTSCEHDDDNDKLPSNADKSFAINAAYANRDEIDFAQLALTKSQNDAVMNFAQTMIADHTTALASLDSLGSRYSITLPTTIDSIHAAMKTQLTALTGYSFDTAYMNGQINDHINAITLFQNEVNSGNNPDIRNYATNNLPHLQMHKQAADSVRAGLQ